MDPWIQEASLSQNQLLPKSPNVVLIPYKNYILVYTVKWEFDVSFQTAAGKLKDQSPCTGGTESFLPRRDGIARKGSWWIGFISWPTHDFEQVIWSLNALVPIHEKEVIMLSLCSSFFYLLRLKATWLFSFPPSVSVFSVYISTIQVLLKVMSPLYFHGN